MRSVLAVCRAARKLRLVKSSFFRRSDFRRKRPLCPAQEMLIMNVRRWGIVALWGII
jgi:hypothetical protein